ncbi:MAG: hypothetical protein ACI8T1_002527 [Verrucomicrobiales bacterium]|jgi:hypothetical protein
MLRIQRESYFLGRTSEHSHCLPTACSDLRVNVVAFIQISTLAGQAVDLLRLVLLVLVPASSSGRGRARELLKLFEQSRNLRRITSCPKLIVRYRAMNPER